MSFTWKDTTTTITLVVIAAITIALMTGFMNDVESRWALGTFAIFILGGLSGLITGASSMMRHAWSRMTLYVLSAITIAITLINAFVNTEAWLLAQAGVMALIWLEFVGLDLFSGTTTDATSNISSHGTA